MLCPSSKNCVKEKAVSDALIAEIVLLHLLGESGKIEHVGRVGHIARSAVALKNLYLVIVNVVHVLAHFEKSGEMACLIICHAEMFRYLPGLGLNISGIKRLFAHLHTEYAAVDEISAQARKNLVGMLAPDLQGAPDVIVVERKVMAQTLGIAKEALTVDIIIQEIAKRRRCEKLVSSPSKFFSAHKSVDQHVLGSHGSLVQIDSTTTRKDESSPAST